MSPPINKVLYYRQDCSKTLRTQSPEGKHMPDLRGTVLYTLLASKVPCLLYLPTFT